MHSHTYTHTQRHRHTVSLTRSLAHSHTHSLTRLLLAHARTDRGSFNVTLEPPVGELMRPHPISLAAARALQSTCAHTHTQTERKR
jgi:hypothetical protein